MQNVVGGQVCRDSLIREYQRKLRTFPTPAEKRFKNVLKRFSEKLIKEYGFQEYFYNRDNGRHYIVDFCWPFYRAIFEVDGPTHDEPKQKEDERIRDAYLNKIGFHVYRISNIDTKVNARCESLLWQAIAAQYKPSRPRLTCVRIVTEKEKQMRAEWEEKQRKKKARRQRRKKNGELTKAQLNYIQTQKIREKTVSHVESLEVQSDPQKAYEQCMKYLKSLAPIPQKVNPSVSIKSRWDRPLKNKLQKCPRCKGEIAYNQKQCSHCGYIREIKKKYEQDAAKIVAALDIGESKTKLKKQAISNH